MRKFTVDIREILDAVEIEIAKDEA